MDKIQKIHDLTLALYNQLQNPLPKDDRESFIKKIHEVLDLREELIKIPLKYELLSEEEKKIGNSIIMYNRKINALLLKNTTIIKSNIKSIRQKKETGVMYENSLETSIDGMYFDKKN